MKKYLPIKIFSIRYGYGWWWGQRVYFFGGGLTVEPIWWAVKHCEYANNHKIIEHGDCRSWRRYNEQFNTR